MENKYYIPNLEDITIDYRCEVKDMNSWHPWVVYSPYDISDLSSWIKTDQVRTKYLDKEDIESLGWECVNDEANARKYRGLFKKDWTDCPDNDCMDHDYGIYTLSVEIYQNWEDILVMMEVIKSGTGGGWGGPYEKVLFQGDNHCNVTSINELKFLMKLLNIK